MPRFMKLICLDIQIRCGIYRPTSLMSIQVLKKSLINKANLEVYNTISNVYLRNAKLIEYYSISITYHINRLKKREPLII